MLGRSAWVATSKKLSLKGGVNIQKRGVIRLRGPMKLSKCRLKDLDGGLYPDLQSSGLPLAN